MARKKTAKKDAEQTALSFEESLMQLQQIVADLEDGKLGLEESIGRFEQGVQLLRVCNQTLTRAEQKIQVLTGMDADGNPLTEPFDDSATFDQQRQQAGRRQSKKVSPDAPEADDDGDEDPPGKRLF